MDSFDERMQDSNWEVRYAAVKELASRPPSSSSTALLLSALEDDDTAVIEAAAEALISQRRPCGAAAVFRLYANGEDDVAQAVQTALERLASDPEIANVAATAAVSRDAEVRAGAIAALGYPFVATSFAEIVHQALDDPDAAVRLAARTAMRWLKRGASGR